MAMSITELERSLRALRLSGMGATLQARALAVASHEMDFIEAFSSSFRTNWTAAAHGCWSAATRSHGSTSAKTSRTSIGATTRLSQSARCSISPP